MTAEFSKHTAVGSQHVLEDRSCTAGFDLALRHLLYKSELHNGLQTKVLHSMIFTTDMTTSSTSVRRGWATVPWPPPSDPKIKKIYKQYSAVA